MDLLVPHSPPRIQRISEPASPAFDVLRLDEVHPQLSGNKWFKLKYNLLKIQEETLRYPSLPCKLVTFGGPFSNHIHACAAAGQALGIQTIGLIRGEEPVTWSPTLQDARNWGMQLEFIQRDAYAEKETEDFKSWIYEQYGHVLIVPEGGSNYLGINGCMDILQGIDLAHYDTVVCAMGTGATVAGLLMSSPAHIRIWGIPVLKGGSFLKDEVRKHLVYFLFDEEAVESVLERLVIWDQYHFGGYGKSSSEIEEFMVEMDAQYQLPLDKVYTAKALKGMLEQLTPSNRSLFIHTGGLQGNRSI
jgi:1-aminocyclopropane-1-carboxylate deaminase